MSDIVLQGNYVNAYSQEVIVDDVVDGVVVVKWVYQDSVDIIDIDDFMENFQYIRAKTKTQRPQTKKQLDKLISTNT